MSNITKNFQHKARRGLGMVHGRQSAGDNIPVKVSADEAIIPKGTVRALGGSKGVAKLIKRTTGKAPTGIRAGSHHQYGGLPAKQIPAAPVLAAGLQETNDARMADKIKLQQTVTAGTNRMAEVQAARFNEVPNMQSAIATAKPQSIEPQLLRNMNNPAGADPSRFGARQIAPETTWNKPIPAAEIEAGAAKLADAEVARGVRPTAPLQVPPTKPNFVLGSNAAAPAPAAPAAPTGSAATLEAYGNDPKAARNATANTAVGRKLYGNVPPGTATAATAATAAPAPMIGNIVTETAEAAKPVRAGIRGMIDSGVKTAGEVATAVKNKIPGMGTAVAETAEAAPKPNAIGRLNSMANEAVDLSKVGSQVAGAAKTGASIPGMVAEGFAKLHSKVGPLLAPVAAVTDIAGDQSATGIAQGAFDVATGLGSKAGGWLTAPADIATRMTNNGRGLVQTMKDRFTGDYVPESAAKGTDQLLSLFGVNGPDTLAAKGGQLYERGMEQQPQAGAVAPQQAGPQVVGLPKPAETYPMSTPGSQQSAAAATAPAPQALDPRQMLDNPNYAIPSGTGSIRSSNGKAMLIDSRPPPEQQAAAKAGPDMSTSAGVLQQAQKLLTSSNTDDRVVGAKLMRHAYPQLVASESSRYGHDKSFEASRLSAEAQRGVMGLEQSRKEDENARQAKDAYRKSLEGQFMKSGKDGKQEVDQAGLGDFMRLAESTAAKRLAEAKTPEEAARWQNRVNGKSRSVAELDDADKSELLKNFRMRARHAEGAGSWSWDNDRADSDDLHDWTPTESNGRLEFPRLSARRSDGKKIGGEAKNYAYAEGPIGFWGTQMGKTPTNEYLPGSK